MKKANFIGTLLVSVAILAASGGCKHPNRVTPIPDLGNRPPGNPTTTTQTGPTSGTPVSEPTPPKATEQPMPLDFDPQLFDNGAQDRDHFKADTVYFDFDSSTIKSSEESKLQQVAEDLKAHKNEGVIIEGNCDERGTEKYNLSLGERRALAAREYLVNLGVDSHHIKTVTYGASRPAEAGHDEAAWQKNRRDEFVLVTPK